MSKARLSTFTPLKDLSNRLTNLRATFNAHAAQSFATAHRGATTQTSTYSDSNGNIVGEQVLVIEDGELVFYVPATVVIGEEPES